MRSRNVVALLAIAVLVSLGAATQYADAYSTNGGIVGTGAVAHDGTFYQKADNNGVYFKVIFDGDRTGSGSSVWDAAVQFGERPSNSELTATNANSSSRVVGSAHDYSSSASFSFSYKAENLDDGATTVTFPAGKIGPTGAAANRNAELTYSFVYDSTVPVVTGDLSTVELDVGTTAPSTPNVRCTDANKAHDHAIRTGGPISTANVEDIVFTYTCTDKAGNISTATKTYRVLDNVPPLVPLFGNPTFSTVNTTPISIWGSAEPGSFVSLFKGDDLQGFSFPTDGSFRFNGVALTEGYNYFSVTATDESWNSSPMSFAMLVILDTIPLAIPTYISIASDNADPTKAKSGDIVTVTFDTEEGSTVKGTIGGENATFALSGTVGTLSRTLDGTESPGVLTFSFVQADATGNTVAAQTAVKGTGIGSSVTADFVAPAIPTDISIASDNADTSLAKSGNTVTVTFDTEEGSTVKGTIGGETAAHNVTGTVGTLKLTLSGDETLGLLTFSFVQTNDDGSAVAQTAVRGTGAATSVTFLPDDSVAPAGPIFANGTRSVNTTPVSFLGVAEPGSTVKLYKGETTVGTVTADNSGSFKFPRVALTEGYNWFRGTATDASSNKSEKSPTILIVLDTRPLVIPTNISIASDNADPTKAKSGDIVTITFDTEAGSTVKGTIGGKVATFTPAGASSTLSRTLDGTESSGVLTFEFTQTDLAGNVAATQTAVKGTGSGTSVTFLPPFAPPSITSPTSGTFSTHDAITVRGTGESGIKIAVCLSDNSNCSDAVTIGADGRWILDGYPLIRVENILKLVSINNGDRKGPDIGSPTVTITYDNTDPVIRGDFSTVQVAYGSGSASLPAVTCSDTNIAASQPAIIDGRAVTTVPGDYTYTFTCADKAGNSVSETKTYRVNLTLNTTPPSTSTIPVITSPTIPVITSPTSGTFSTHNAITVRGTGEPGIKIAVCSTVTCSGAVTIGADGRWTLEDFSLFNGENVFKLFYILADGFTKDPDGLLDSPTVTITYERPTFTDLIANNIKSSLNPNDDQIIYHYITTPSNVVSLYGTSAPNIKLDLMHITGYDPDPYAEKTFTSFTVIETFVSNSDGIWQSGNFTLNEGSNIFYLRGHDNPKYGSGTVAIVTYDPAVDEITVGDKGFHKPELIPKDSVSRIKSISDSEPQSQKKSSGSSNDWHKKPTFGESHLTYKQIVDNGFSFNGYSLTVTDNWHTDFHLTSSLIGETNTVKIKTYAADPLKWINLYLGVPRLGDVSDAESEIQLIVSRDYNNPVDYTIDEINHYQAEELVNVDDTTASLQKIKCQASDKDKKCYEFTINFTVMAPLHDEIVAISAMDEKRRQHVTYINEGVEFTGESLLDAHTAQLMQKKTNQGQAEIIELIQQDRRYNVWADQHGYLWTLNEYGTWTQITVADFERHQDGASSVMTRQNSNFASLIEQERQKALLVFDSSELISELDDYFAYDYSNVDSDMSKLEKYAYELQLESERAEKYTRQN